MYLQITTRCNMSCPHCCYSCTKEGEDMSLGTFTKALELCEGYGDAPFLGGGEPTLHPQFERFLLDAIATAGEIDDGVQAGIITNGSIRKRALMIAKLSKAGVIWGSVSKDQYHDAIDDDVTDAFENVGNGSKGTHDTSRGGYHTPLPHGRAKELMGWDNEDEENERTESECPCDSLMVKPNGDIHQCGCEDSPLVGHVDTGIDSPYHSICCKSQEFVDACIENECDSLLC